MNDVTTLPISPQSFWTLVALLGVLALSVLIYGALSGLGKDHRPPVWEQVGEKWRLPTILMGLLWLGLFFLTIAAAYVGVWQAIQPEGKAVQPGLGLGALLAALLGAPFVIWGTWLKYQTVRYQKEGHITDRINKAVEQLGAEKTVKVRTKDEEGKDITIEETRPNIEVRIGAILSLERIAQDSTIHDKGRDHVRVMEILCAYVRENAPASSAQESMGHIYERERATWDNDPAQFTHWFCEKFGTTPDDLDEITSIDSLKIWAASLPMPRTDVMQALKVIGRRTPEQRRVEAAWPNVRDETSTWPFDLPCPRLQIEAIDAEVNLETLQSYYLELEAWGDRINSYRGYRLNLAETNLQGAELSPQRIDSSDAVYCGAILTGARLDGAKLEAIRLNGALVTNASLQGADLSEAEMCGVNLSGAFLDGARLYLVRLERSKLSGASMKGANLLSGLLLEADLSYVEMRGANLSFAWLNRATLYAAMMEGVDLSDSRMNGAILSAANMKGSNLCGAQMRNARLMGAWLENANLSDARMQGADLTNSWMQYVSLRRAQFDHETKWLAAMPRQAGAQFVDFSSTSIVSYQVEELFGDATNHLPDGILWPAHWPVRELLCETEDEFEMEWQLWRADPAGYRPPPPPAGQ